MPSDISQQLSVRIYLRNCAKTSINACIYLDTVTKMICLTIREEEDSCAFGSVHRPEIVSEES